MEAGEEPFNSQLFFEGPNSSPPVGSVHPLKRKRLWAKTIIRVRTQKGLRDMNRMTLAVLATFVVILLGSGLLAYVFRDQ